MGCALRAIVFEEHGGVEKLKEAILPDPVAGPGEAVVRVASCALNHLDIWVREGLPGRPPIPMPHIGGCDVSGTVETLGPGADPSLKVGAPVLVAPGISCGECPACLASRENLCPKFNVLGFQRQGGLAEKVLVPARNLLPLATTSRFSLQEWAAFPLVFTTAWSMLVDKVGLKTGETVLIHAAGSGVGSAAVQLAKSIGARVITTVGEDWKAVEARKLGADEVINYKREDFERRAKDLTGGRGVEVVFEHIGPEVFTQSLRCLAPGGRLVTCGSTSGPDISLNLRAVFARNLSIHGNYMGPLRGLKEGVGLAEAGKVHPVVGKIFPLAATREAQQCMLDRAFFGKIVINIH
jgi:NADPH:quinone reductase-like Zn-dependent oxidoreductase